jgi:hypothetical protein
MTITMTASSPNPHPHPPEGDLEVLAAWAPELADTFVALACDIALVIDADGRIASFAQRDEQPIASPAWIGKMWSQTVVIDSRAKVQQMLADVAQHGRADRREINHLASHHSSSDGMPVAYSAARLGTHGPTLAVGQDLRAQAALQQRFVAAQEALERSYWNAQRLTRQPPTENKGMTPEEKEALGLEPPRAPTTHDLRDSELVKALGLLVERIDHDQLPGLLRDARRLAENHFLARAMARAGGVETSGFRPGPRWVSVGAAWCAARSSGLLSPHAAPARCRHMLAREDRAGAAGFTGLARVELAVVAFLVGRELRVFLRVDLRAVSDVAQCTGLWVFLVDHGRLLRLRAEGNHGGAAGDDLRQEDSALNRLLA